MLVVVAAVGSSSASARFQRSVRSRSQAISPTLRLGERALNAKSSRKRDPMAACGYAAAVWGGFSAHAHGSISSIFEIG